MSELPCPCCQSAIDPADRYCRSCGHALGAGGYADDLYATVVEALPMGLFLLDATGRVRYWNRTMEDYTEVRRREVLGRPLETVLPFLEPYLNQVMRVLDTGLPMRLDQVAHGGLEGAPLTATLCFRPVILQDSTAAVLGVMEDITQKVMVNNQLIRSERLAAVGELAAGVAHNFNNILAAIGGDAQLLRMTAEEERLPSHVGEAAQQIYQETMRGGRIAHELLSFARGAAEPRIQRLDIHEVVQDVLRLVKNHPAARTVSIEVEVSPTVPNVEADPDLLHQVFFNLVLNALQAMPNGGILTIGALARGHEQDPRTGLVDVKFHDTGVGIPPQHLRRIFDPFYSNRAGGASGSGLGLPVSLAMVKSIGGDIQVASVEGIGTTVTVSLPIVERRTTPRPGRRLPSGRVLLIDDDANVRRTLGTLLGRRGFEIIEAGDADDAIYQARAAAREAPLDLVLMEPMLAKGDGVLLMRRLRDMMPDAPVVILTGATDPEFLLAAIENGARFAFSKPPDFKELLAVVDAITKRSALVAAEPTEAAAK